MKFRRIPTLSVLIARRYSRFQNMSLMPLLMFTATAGSLIAVGLAFFEVQATLEPRGAAALVVFLGTILISAFSCLGLLTTLVSIRRRKMSLFDSYLLTLALSACGVTIYLASWHLVAFRPWAY